MKDRLRKRRRSLTMPAEYRRKSGLATLCAESKGDMKPLTFADLEAALNLRVDMYPIQHPMGRLLLRELLREPEPAADIHPPQDRH